jgi:hypothetical protein
MGFKQSRYFNATGSPAAQIHNSPRRERVLFLDGLDEVSAWPTDGADEVFTSLSPNRPSRHPTSSMPMMTASRVRLNGLNGRGHRPSGRRGTGPLYPTLRKDGRIDRRQVWR